MLGAIADILRSRSSEGWLVGGSVRDRLSDRYSPDLDVVVSDDPSKVAKRLADKLQSPCFSLSDRYPTYRVLGPEGHVDIAALRGESILQDLAERDFTVNAMALPLAASSASEAPERAVVPESLDEDLLLDPFEGATHLKERRLVAVSDRIFTDDPLRLMRAARFCHTLGLEPEAALADLIRSQARLLPAAAAERVVSEMSITLAAGRTAEATKVWAELGLLEFALPEVVWAKDGAGAGLGPDASTLDALDAMLDSPGDRLSYEAAELLGERMRQPVDGSVERPAALRLAALVQGVGVEQVQVMGRRLKLSGALNSLLCAAARCAAGGRGRTPTERAHMLAQLLPEGAAVSRAAVLFLWDAAGWEPEVVLLAAAAAAGGARVGAEAAAVDRLMALAVARVRGVAPLPVNGEDLMRELGLEGGPALGRVLREVRLAWEASEIADRHEALAVARAAAGSE